MSAHVVRVAKRALAIAGKEWMHLGRDPATLLFALGMPVILLVIFGYAVSFDVDAIRTLVVDDDHTAESRALVAHLYSGPTFVPAGTRATAADAEHALRADDARLVLVIPRGYASDLARGGEGRVQLLVDAADNMTAASVLSYATRFTVAVDGALAKDAGSALPQAIEARVRALYNPAMRSVVFLVPGLIAIIQAMMAVLLTALTVAREWERGSMEQLFATPVGRLEIVVGKLVPYFGVAMLQLLIILVIGSVLFDMPMRGSLLLLFGISTLFLAATLGQGLVISVVTRNQMVATQAAAVSSMLPSMLLSGFIMPIDNMPPVLQVMSNILPARHFIHALRAILLRGAGIDAVLRDAFFLAAFAIVMLAIATQRFPRRIA